MTEPTIRIAIEAPGLVLALHALAESLRPALLAPPPAEAHPEPPPTPAAYVSPKWTPERRECISEYWRLPIAQLGDRVRALPGDPVTNSEICTYGLGALHLPLRSSFAQQPAPTPKPAPPPPKPAALLPKFRFADGKRHGTFAEIKAWAAKFGIAYDGSNMDAVNKISAMLKQPEIVQIEDPR